MTNMLDKERVQAALAQASGLGKNHIREFDKVWAAINRGEFDIEPETPELVLHAEALLAHREEHSKGEEYAARYILARYGATPMPVDPFMVGTGSGESMVEIGGETMTESQFNAARYPLQSGRVEVGTRSDLDDANVPRNEAEVLHEMESLVTELVGIAAAERAERDDVHEDPVLLHWAAFAEYSSMKLMDERHTASVVMVPLSQSAATSRGLFEFGVDAFKR